ncbi:MAG: alcohol dehydrogenase catalytic domain-containing protein [Spirochaetes bacterium]|nr:alcohol dehydrogenase catalytic domain-containing protein [Spirochaetota bacterium]
MIIIKILAAGICRADVKEVSNSREIPEDRGPLFGHEINGIITFAGKNTGFQNGSHVAFNPNVTRNRTTGFAEYMVVHDSKDKLEQALYSYNENLNSKKTILAEPFSCVIHSFYKLQKNTEYNSVENKMIAIIGAGNAGMSFGLLAKQNNAQIKIFNIHNKRLKFAENIFPKEELVLLSDFKKYKEKFDIVIICSTTITDEVLKSGQIMVKREGPLHIYGGTRPTDRFLDSNINIDKIRRNESIITAEYQNKIISISGAYGFNAKDFKTAFDIMEQFPLDKFISKEIEFKDFPDLIMNMSAGKTDYPGKVIIKL